MRRVIREESPKEDDHAHCEICYHSNCVTKLPVVNRCPIHTCKLECGARFHACKAEEHKLLCVNEKVKCINSENGCPLLLLRSQLGSHLQRCPASVVYCTMEWNRWPVYSRERQSRVPFVTDNIHARNGQLDVALALRDQRMLNEAMKAPRSVRRVLRNNLTQRFPAVPIRHGSCKLPDIESSNTSRTVSDDEGDVSQRQKHTKSPKDQSLNQELLDATRTAAGRLSEAIQVVLDNENNPSVELGAALPVTGHQCSSAAEEMLSQDLNGRHDVSMDTSDEQLIEELPRIVEVKSSPKDGVRPITNHENDVDNWSASSVDNVIKTLQENDTRYNLYINVVGLDLSQPKEADSSKDEGVVTSYKLPAVEVPIPPPPPLNTKDALSLDLNLESITRYQAKPRSMYTFLCAQEFRRDEYSSHFKNVHDDIHGGLNGWLEQRCPLAHYGCNYSLRRLHPKESGAHVVHNRALESFGVRPFLPEYQQDQESSTNGNFFVPSSTDVEIRESDVSPDDNAAVSVNGNCEQCHDKSSDNMDVSTSPGYLSNTSHENSRCQRNLMQLPFEVLRHVCTFLDGYSMCNIALTCHLLREVACSLLEEKGIVIQQWARMQVNNKNHWYISYKRWIFSTAFTAVESWGFEDHPHMANHLSRCPFYLKTKATDPHHLPNIKCELHHSENFRDVMKRMYPDFTIKFNGDGAMCNGDSGFC